VDSSEIDTADQRLYEVLLNYLEAEELGVQPEPAELLGRHPEFADELKGFMDTRNQLEDITAPLRGATHTVHTAAPRCEAPEGVVSPPAHEDESPDALFEDQPFSYPAGRYQFLGEVARGGMGVIVKARDTHLDREMAFKFLLNKHVADAELRRRFAREARISGRLQHPGIVAVYDTGHLTDARPYFTMSLVKGQTLARLLGERSDLARELPHFLKIFEQICQTVAYAHTEGVIHRDLKPANVMVSPFGVVRVMDWGLAKVMRGAAAVYEAPTGRAAGPGGSRAEGSNEDCTVGGADSVSRTGQAIGTPAFMSPAQARGEVDRLDERADVFGLGAILCVILTGCPPYVGTPEEILAKAAAGDLTDAFARLDACTAEREWIGLAKRCLAVERADRLRHAGEVAAAVTAYIESDLRRAERDLVRFFDLSPDLFCLASLDGFFRRVNVNFSRVLGHTDAELLSHPFLDFVHPEDRARTRVEMEKLTRGLPVIRFVNRYRDVRGSYHWFEWTGKSIPEEGVIFAVARDVTERVEPESGSAAPEIG
jgi:serine/threonine-protein kinase